MYDAIEIAIGFAAVAMSILGAASQARRLRQQVRAGTVGVTSAVVFFAMTIFGLLLISMIAVTIVGAGIGAYVAVSAGHPNAFGLIPVYAVRIVAGGFIAAALSIPFVARWLHRSKR